MIISECGLTFSEENLKIVGGITAEPHSWPSIALIEFNYKSSRDNYTNLTIFRCGGSLYDKRTVLTAAHCIPTITSMSEVIPNVNYPTYESMYTVYLGLHDKSNLNGTTKRGVRKIIKVKLKSFALTVNSNQ